MKNKWCLLLLLFTCFNNYQINAQTTDQNDDMYSWSGYIKSPDFYAKNYGLNLEDTTDMFYSPASDIPSFNENIKLNEQSYKRIVYKAEHGNVDEKCEAIDTLGRVGDTTQIPLLKEF